MKGSCLCSAVAYEVSRPADGLHIGLCSCRSCRKAHAAPFNVYASVPRADFRWLRGEDKTRIYESSPGKNRHFCSVCGSQLIAEHPGESNVLLRVALLDEDPGARPVSIFSVVSRCRGAIGKATLSRAMKTGGHQANRPPGTRNDR